MAIFMIIALVTVVPLVEPDKCLDQSICDTTMFPYTYFPLDLSQLVNLPMWGSSFQDYHGNSFIVYGGVPRQINGSILVSSSDMLILSGSPIQQLDVSIYNDNDQNNWSIDANGYQRGGAPQQHGVQKS